MEQENKTAPQIEQPEATRPGPKTFLAVIVIALIVAAYFNWSDLKAAVLDFV